MIEANRMDEPVGAAGTKFLLRIAMSVAGTIGVAEYEFDSLEACQAKYQEVIAENVRVTRGKCCLVLGKVYGPDGSEHKLHWDY
jgi:hypothetical protein